MRLFHVSEEENIEVFEPSLPTRSDMDKNVGLMWALDEMRLPNFLTPRDCPRVTCHASDNTSDEDKKRFFTSSASTHVVVVESKWLEKIMNTTLYVYEFDEHDFVLQDGIAGYYVAKNTQYPIKKHVITDLLSALIERNVEIRIVDNLWDIAERIKNSTLNWSLCRMAFALPKNN